MLKDLSWKTSVASIKTTNCSKACLLRHSMVFLSILWPVLGEKWQESLEEDLFTWLKHFLNIPISRSTFVSRMFAYSNCYRFELRQVFIKEPKLIYLTVGLNWVNSFRVEMVWTGLLFSKKANIEVFSSFGPKWPEPRLWIVKF